MLSLVIDINIILLLLLLLYIGYYAGIIKSFFATASGFFAIILAENYPYQTGINYYFVFVAVAVIIFLVGIFVFKVVKFLYLSIFDKLAGACLGLFLWFILSANVVIPSLNVYADKMETIAENFSVISNLSKKTCPTFGKYVPGFIADKKLKDMKDYISLLKEKKQR